MKLNVPDVVVYDALGRVVVVCEVCICCSCCASFNPLSFSGNIFTQNFMCRHHWCMHTFSQIEMRRDVKVRAEHQLSQSIYGNWCLGVTAMGARTDYTVKYAIKYTAAVKQLPASFAPISHFAVALQQFFIYRAVDHSSDKHRAPPELTRC